MSVIFSFRKDSSSTPSVVTTENVPPYALFGDDDGDYRAGHFSYGTTYVLTATPFPEADGMGLPGDPLTITFVLRFP